MSLDLLRERLRQQDGVISRAQALASGVTQNDLRRLLRNRRLTLVHAGVYVDHTGTPNWKQRAWAAVLATGGVLDGESALRAAEGQGRRGPRGPADPLTSRADSDVIRVAVDWRRTVQPPASVVVRRLRGLDSRASWNAHPPRMRVEEALLDVAASAATDIAAVARVADAVQAGLTTADRLSRALDERGRIARRALLSDALIDIAAGTCSVLEREYLHRVERAHRLPRPERQARARVDKPTIRDIDYPRYGLVIDRPCATARQIEQLLRRRGWSGEARPCTRCGFAVTR